jgi:Ca2+-binding RTX toxin-like protein
LGKDTLTGGEGKDLFALQPGTMTTITDFTDGQDLLQLSRGLNFTDLKITQGEGENAVNFVISLNNNNEPMAILNGVSANSIDAADFAMTY